MKTKSQNTRIYGCSESTATRDIKKEMTNQKHNFISWELEKNELYPKLAEDRNNKGWNGEKERDEKT